MDRLAAALTTVSKRVTHCKSCGKVTEDNPCAICTDEKRDHRLICVVEEAFDVESVESAGVYKGLYHVLGGRLSPLDGIGPDDLSFDALVRRTKNGSGVKEVVVATNPSMEGEATATYLKGLLEDTGVTVSRIALGLPVGGDLQYADAVTIARALSERKEMA